MPDIMENILQKTGIAFDLKRTIVVFSYTPVSERKKGVCGL